MPDRARYDVNNRASLIAVSNADGITPVSLWADPGTHALITSGGGGGGGADVQYVELVSTAPATGTLALGRYKSSPPSLTDGQMYGLQLDSSGNLKVTGSLSVGGTTDNSAYTAGSSSGTPSMGFYHATIDTVTDGRAATVAITSKRAMMVNLQTAAGAEAGVAAVPLQVSLANTASNATAIKVDGSAVMQLVSTNNSSTATLTSGSTFTGTSEDVTNYGLINVTVFSDVASATDGLSIQQSSNGTNWDIVDPYTITAATGKTFSVPRQGKFFRIVYTNGGTNQASFRLQSIFTANASKGSSVRPADAISNENDLEQMAGFGMLYNGTTWDRARGNATDGAIMQNRPDGVTTGTITANLQTVSAAVTSGMSGVSFLVYGTYVGITLSWEFSGDGGTTWGSLGIVNVGGGGAPQLTNVGFTNLTAAAYAYTGEIPSGTTNIRARASTYSSGTANIRVAQSNEPKFPGTSISGQNLNQISTLLNITGSVVPGVAATNLGKAEDAVAASGDTGVFALGIQTASPTDTAADGDYVGLQVKNGRLWASSTIDTALPAGAAIIGALVANQTVNVAQINGTTPLMGNGVTGTGSQRVTIASDNTAFSVNANAGTNLNTSALALETGGNLATLAGTVSSSRTAVNLISGQAGVAAGVGATGATVQRIVVANDAGRTLTSTGGAVSSSGNNTLLAAGTNRLKVYAFSLSTTSATAVTCIFQSGASGTELWRVILQAPASVSTGANLVVQPPAWLFATASVTLLNLNLSSAISVNWAVSYFDEA